MMTFSSRSCHNGVAQPGDQPQMTRSSSHSGIRRSALLAVLAGLAACGIARAEEYRLGPQDRLRIYVSEWPALTGELVVGPTGEITMPVIGRVPAANLSTLELASAIGQRLQEKARLGQAPDTAVDVAVYRPFYILGNVQQPGEFPYRPGMRVLNALSIAGGIFRNERGLQWDMDKVSLSSRGELAVLATRRADLKAERIRLEAELDDRQAFPPAPADADETFRRALGEQRRIFEASLERRRSERTLLQNSIASITREIASIAEQIVDVGQKVKATQAELEQVRKLAKDDLAVHRLLPMERIFADVRREQKDLEISRLRAEQRLNDTRRTLVHLDEERRNTALAGIQNVNAQMREADERQDALVQLLDGAAAFGDATDQAMISTVPARVTIVRAEGDTVRQIEADELTRVMPGDIIKVPMSGEARAAGVAGAGAAIADLSGRPEKGR